MPMSTMDDKARLGDLLASQKMTTDTYNTFSNECSTARLRSDFLNILQEEHDIQYDIFNEMSMRGWYQVQPAEQQKVQQTKQKFQSMA